MTARTLARRVIAWQRTHGRHGLPWQGTRDAYRVWLSEVMLQQTQVSTVLDYYGRFLQKFPDVAALAAAPLDDVLALWSGLGYYSRARNLHRCAQVIVGPHGGAFPRTSAALAALPGIGRSTAAAIAAFCFGERAAILDGNVKRVLARALGFAGDLASATEQHKLWLKAEALLPRRDVDVYTQGLMDLGATVCLARQPLCSACPVAADCVAFNEAAITRYPVKSRRSKRGARSHALLWAVHAGRTWLTQRPATGVWAGLWSLPEFADTAALAAFTSGWPGEGESLPAFQHVLTHFNWQLAPVRWTLPAGGSARAASSTHVVRVAHAAHVAKAKPAIRATKATEALATHHPGRWFTVHDALALGLPAPIRRLLQTNG